MRVVPEGEPLAPPSLCFICETSPIREGVTPNVVDTQRQYNPPAMSHLSGTKFLCERCIDEAAHLLGFVRTDEIETAQNALNQAQVSMQLMAETAQSLTTEAGSLLGGITAAFPSAQLVNISKSSDVVKPTKAATKEAKNGA